MGQVRCRKQGLQLDSLTSRPLQTSGEEWVALCPLYLVYPIQWSLNARCPAGHPDPGTNRQSPKPLTAPGLELFEGELLGEEFLNKPIIKTRENCTKWSMNVKGPTFFSFQDLGVPRFSH